MLHFSNKRKKRRKQSENNLVTWIVVIVAIVAILQSTSKEAAKDTVQNVTQTSMAGFEDFKKKVLLPATVFHVEDSAEGDGAPIICGQQASIAYSSFKGENDAIDDSATSDKPLTFHVGDHSVMPAIERGVLGMKVGGKRKIFAPWHMSYGVEKFARNDVDQNMAISFDVELLDIKPKLPDYNDTPFHVITAKQGSGKSLECGETVKMHLTLWSVDGKKIFPTTEQTDDMVSFTIGASDTFIGLEQGVLGMNVGEARTLIIPPLLQKTMNGDEPKLQLPLPKNQVIIVDLESIP